MAGPYVLLLSPEYCGKHIVTFARCGAGCKAEWGSNLLDERSPDQKPPAWLQCAALFSVNGAISHEWRARPISCKYCQTRTRRRRIGALLALLFSQRKDQQSVAIVAVGPSLGRQQLPHERSGVGSRLSLSVRHPESGVGFLVRFGNYEQGQILSRRCTYLSIGARGKIVDILHL
jgi:hypothetical protein